MYFFSKTALRGATWTTYCVSGDTVPSGVDSGWFWYDTSNNLLKRYIDNAWVAGYSLPICIARTSGIKQVFNGFGYIGATVWIDKDVKALVPNGRNEDYSLNNIIHTTPKILVRQFPTNANGDYYIGIDLSNDDYIVPQDIIVLDRKAVMYEQDTRPNVTIAKWFDTADNQYYFWNEKDPRPEINDLYKLKDLFVATCYIKDGVITCYSPKQPIKALNEQDKEIISAWGFPSDKYVELSLGATGSKYTAPANGWFAVFKASTASGQYFVFNNQSANFAVNWQGTGGGCYLICPVKRGDIITTDYTLGGATNYFRFIYTQAEA
jgi:hypothetical protein